MNQLTSKYVIVLLFGMSITFSLSAQSFKDVYPVRSYNNSLLLSLEEDSNSQLTIGDYGSIAYSSGNFDSATDRYLYQGQEYSKNLGLHLYPYRVYSATQKRFFSPDPKSQYFSPYLFVAADPINLIDYDGQTGKPLFLFAQDQRYKSWVNAQTADMMNAAGDAHFVPMTKFINREVGKLEDWNGNVFMIGHMSPEKKAELIVETSGVEDDLLSEHDMAVSRAASKSGYETTFDAKEMGRMLRQFSEDQGVPIKNIVAGGCQGSIPGERIFKGFMKESAKRVHKVGQELSVTGFRKGNRSVVAGEITAEKTGYAPPYFKTRLHINPQKGRKICTIDPAPGGKKSLRSYSYRDETGRHDLKYIDGEDLSGYINGRVPEHLSEEFTVFKGVY